MRILPIIFVAACAPGVPEQPSFQQHVAPILAANCVRCHGVPSIGGAPSGLRLDTYASSTYPVADDVALTLAVGAAAAAGLVAERIVDDARPMPPRFGLADWQIETLQRWGEAPTRGEPRPGNRAPTARVDALDPTAGRIAIELRVDDADPDLVGGILWGRVGTRAVPIALVHAGINRITWDTGAVAPADYALEVALDDGAAETRHALGTITVEAP